MKNITDKMVSLKEYDESVAFMAGLLKEKIKRVNALEKSEQECTKKLKESTKMLKLYKSLVENKAIYVKTYSQDCDGVEGCYNYKFTSIDAYEDCYEAWCDGIEGRCSWEVVQESELHDEEDCGTYGQGWDIV